MSGARNTTLPGGAFDSGGRHVVVDPNVRDESFRGMESLLLGPSGTGTPVRLRDVAALSRGYENPPRYLNYLVSRDRTGRWQRSRAITLAIQMRSGEQIGQFGVDVDQATFVGGAGPRFWFSIEPEQQQLNYAQIIVEVTDKHLTKELVGPLQGALSSKVPGARIDVRQLETGKPVGIPVSIRVSGEDIATLRSSLIVFAAIPYGMVGALAMLQMMHQPFGFMAFLGIASLVGVIVSHVIVLFDFIEEAHHKGLALEDALIDAAIVRLRPVMITVGATVLGLVPLAMHGGPLWEPLCYAQIGGSRSRPASRSSSFRSSIPSSSAI